MHSDAVPSLPTAVDPAPPPTAAARRRALRRPRHPGPRPTCDPPTEWRNRPTTWTTLPWPALTAALPGAVAIPFSDKSGEVHPFETALALSWPANGLLTTPQRQAWNGRAMTAGPAAGLLQPRPGRAGAPRHPERQPPGRTPALGRRDHRPRRVVGPARPLLRDPPATRRQASRSRPSSPYGTGSDRPNCSSSPAGAYPTREPRSSPATTTVPDPPRAHHPPAKPAVRPAGGDRRRARRLEQAADRMEHRGRHPQRAHVVGRGRDQSADDPYGRRHADRALRPRPNPATSARKPRREAARVSDVALVAQRCRGPSRSAVHGTARRRSRRPRFLAPRTRRSGRAARSFAVSGSARSRLCRARPHRGRPPRRGCPFRRHSALVGRGRRPAQRVA